MSSSQKTEHTLGNLLQSLPCGGPHSYRMLLTLTRMSPFLKSCKSAGFAWKRNAFSHGAGSTSGIVIITWDNDFSWTYLITLLFLSLFHVKRGWRLFSGVWREAGKEARAYRGYFCLHVTQGFFWDRVVKAFVDVNAFS